MKGCQYNFWKRDSALQWRQKCILFPGQTSLFKPFTIITLGQSFNFKAEDERGEDANMRNAVFLSRKLGLAAAAGQARGGQVDRVKIGLGR